MQKNIFNDNNIIDINLDDPKLVNIEEIIKVNSSLPPITMSNKHNSIKLKSDIIKFKGRTINLKPKFKSKFSGNSSLPPIPSNRIAEVGVNQSSKRISALGKHPNPYGLKLHKGRLMNSNIVTKM